MARTALPKGRPRLIAAALSVAAVAAGVAGFWALRGGPGDAPSDGTGNGSPRARAAADTPASTSARLLHVPGNGAPVIGAFGRRIRDQLAAQPPPTRPLSGAVEIDAEDVVWREPAGPPGARGGPDRSSRPIFARAAAVSAELAVEGLYQGDVRLRDAVLTGAVVNLRESGGVWNHDVVLAELLGGDESAQPPRVARLDDVTIRDGTLNVGTAERSFALERLNAQLREAEFSGPSLPEPRIVVARAAADLALAGEQPIALTVEDATARVLTDTVAFDIGGGTIEGARLAEVTGKWSSAIPAFGVLAQGRAVDVTLESIQRFLPDQAPRQGIASFTWSITESAPGGAIKGDPGLGRVDLVIRDLDFSGEGSRVTGGIAVQVGENLDRVDLLDVDVGFEPLDVRLVEVFTGPLPFAGTATGTVRGPAHDLAFDVAARLTMEDVADPLIGSVTGRIGMIDDEVVLHGAEAILESVPLDAARRWVPTLPLAGTASGRVTLTGPPDMAPLSLDLELALAAGDAMLAGTVDLTGAAPAYDLTGTVTGIDIALLLQPDAPPVTVTARFALDGSGTRPAEADARIDLDGQFQGWRAVEGDGFSIGARVAGGVLAVDTAWARLAGAAGSLAGDWRFIAPGSGSVSYAVTIASLEPWGPYLPVVGDTSAAGSLDLTGTLEGSLNRPQLTGHLHGADLRSGSWAAGSVETAYAVRLGGPVPEGTVELRASGLRTPIPGEYQSVSLSASLVNADLTFALDADRSDGRGVEIEASGNIPGVGPREVVAERLDFDLPDARWALTEPAVFRWNAGAGLAVDRFEMREDGGSGAVRLAGTLLPLDELAVDLDVTALPVQEIEQLLGREPLITGELALSGRIEGPGSAPTADLEFQLENGSIDSVAVTRFDGTLAYAVDRLSATADAAIGPGDFQLEIELPAAIDFTAERKLALAESGPLSGRLVARGVSITPLQRLSWQIRDLTGSIDGEIDVAGSIANPRLDGRLGLTGGAVRVPALRAAFTNVTGQIALSGPRVTIESFQAESDGLMTAGGTVTFDDLTDPSFDVAIDFDGFRPFGVPGGRTPAEMFGDVSLDGPVDELVVTGNVRVADGDVVVPRAGPAEADDMFGDFPELTADGAAAPPPSPDAPTVGLTIRDLVVDVDRNVWIDAEAARAQLSGELVLNRTADALEIEGILAGERGTFTLEAGPIVRRFEILSAELTFRPETPEIDPTIDVLARRYVFDPSNRQVDVEVRIGGTLRNPTLALASPGAPSFAQPELLSLLLFGRPTLEPGSGQVAAGVLEGSIAELASLELEQALVRDLGVDVDVLEVRFGRGGVSGFGNPTFVIGVELARDVFLTAESALGGLFSTSDATANAWALRVEWAFRRHSRLRASWEPVTQSTFLRGFDLGFEQLTQRQQLSFDLRRRWSY